MCDLLGIYLREKYFRLGDAEKYGKKSGIFGKLRVPGTDFINFVKAMEATLMENINSCITGHIRQEIMGKLKNILFTAPCPDFPVEYVQELFFRMRLYYIVKYANRNLPSTRRKNQKIQILTHV